MFVLVWCLCWLDQRCPLRITNYLWIFFFVPHTFYTLKRIPKWIQSRAVLSERKRSWQRRLAAFPGQPRIRFNAPQSDRRQRPRRIDDYNDHVVVCNELFATTVAPRRAGSCRPSQRQPFRSRVRFSILKTFASARIMKKWLFSCSRSDHSLSGLDSPLPPPPIRCCCIQGCVRKKAVLKDGRRPAVSAWQRYWIQLSGSNLLFYQPKHLRGYVWFPIMNFRILIVLLICVLGRTDLISDDGLLKPFLLLAGQWNDITVLAIRTLFYWPTH